MTEESDDCNPLNPPVLLCNDANG